MKPFSKPGKRKRFCIYLASLLCWILTVTTSNPISFQFQPIQGASPAGITTNTLPQITGPQKADGMWSVDFHKQIAQYQERSLIASSPNGDILLITEDNMLHCLDCEGNFRWKQRIQVSPFYAIVESTLILIDLFFNAFFKEDLPIVNRSTLPQSIHVYPDEIILVVTEKAMIAYSSEGEVLWMRNQKLPFVQALDSKMLFQHQNNRHTRILALSSDGRTNWSMSMNKTMESTWIDIIDSDRQILLVNDHNDKYQLMTINNQDDTIILKEETLDLVDTPFEGEMISSGIISVRGLNYKLGGKGFCVSPLNITLGYNQNGRYLLQTKEVSANEAKISTIKQSIAYYDWANVSSTIYNLDSSKQIVHGGYTHNAFNHIVLFSEELVNGTLEYVVLAYDFSGDFKWKHSLGSNLYRGINRSSDIKSYRMDQSGNLYISYIEKFGNNSFKLVVIGLSPQGKQFLRKEIASSKLIKMITKTIPDDVFDFAGLTYNNGLMLINSTGKKLFKNTLTVIYDKEE
jgi:hypothetical protein